jgi:hypothetical protein
MATGRRSLDRGVEYLSSWLSYRHPYTNITGYAVAVSWRGELVLNEAYGYADLKGPVDDRGGTSGPPRCGRTGRSGRPGMERGRTPNEAGEAAQRWGRPGGGTD